MKRRARSVSLARLAALLADDEPLDRAYVLARAAERRAARIAVAAVKPVEALQPARLRVAPEPRKPEHGTPSGYRAHIRNDEEACAPCREAHLAANRAYKATFRARECQNATSTAPNRTPPVLSAAGVLASRASDRRP